MAELEAPIATYRGSVDGVDMLAGLTGSTAPFAPEKIRALYPTREAYVRAYREAVDRGVEAGCFLAESAHEMKERAEKIAADLHAW